MSWKLSGVTNMEPDSEPCGKENLSLQIARHGPLSRDRLARKKDTTHQATRNRSLLFSVGQRHARDQKYVPNKRNPKLEGSDQC